MTVHIEHDACRAPESVSDDIEWGFAEDTAHHRESVSLTATRGVLCHHLGNSLRLLASVYHLMLQKMIDAGKLSETPCQRLSSSGAFPAPPGWPTGLLSALREHFQ